MKNVKIKNDLHKLLTEISKKKGISIQWQVDDILRKHFDDKEKEVK